MVICGGYTGVMAAVTEGARAAGGMVVGVLSGADARGAHPGLSAVVATGMGQARNAVIVGSADAVIVVGGSGARSPSWRTPCAAASRWSSSAAGGCTTRGAGRSLDR